jgi:hypothetical protein
MKKAGDFISYLTASTAGASNLITILELLVVLRDR